ncbi:MAG: DUF1579 domain-containing protein [candidate division Zixibacteria bacterium]|nr:DUF1579 domain-containing protein [candidate division Zixibacteria bacterium]
MKTKLFVLVGVVAVILSGIYIVACSDEAPMTEEEMMALWAKYGQPGEQHEKLAGLVGTWDFTSKWWQDPSAPPGESKGTAEVQTILKGRFIQEDIHGEMQGAPFHGINFMGYDNFKEKYVMTWMDDMSTSIMVSYGKPNSSGDEIRFEGTYDDFMTGEKGKVAKSMLRFVSEDEHVYEMYEMDDEGKEFKTFEVIYTRQE